jgi:hypothetical protein
MGSGRIADHKPAVRAFALEPVAWARIVTESKEGDKGDQSQIQQGEVNLFHWYLVLGVSLPFCGARLDFFEERAVFRTSLLLQKINGCSNQNNPTE